MRPFKNQETSPPDDRDVRRDCPALGVIGHEDIEIMIAEAFAVLRRDNPSRSLHITAQSHVVDAQQTGQRMWKIGCRDVQPKLLDKG